MYLTQLIKSFNPKKMEKPLRLDSGPPLETSEAVVVLQKAERTRQACEAMRLKRMNKKQRQLADKRNRTGLVITQEMAAIKIQAALRGMLWRRRIQQEADEVWTCLTATLVL
jgi:IQ and AAA domain-containing protein